MIPIAFEEANIILDKPPELTRNECEPLNAHVAILQLENIQSKVWISCWKLSKEELEEINRTGRIYLNVICSTMPPVFITTEFPIDYKG